MRRTQRIRSANGGIRLLAMVVIVIVALAIIATPIMEFLRDYPSPGKNPYLVAILVFGLVVAAYTAYDMLATKLLSDDDYILPESSTRYYSVEELDKLDDWHLWMARNEIYARHGRKFTNDEAQEYFDGKDWYEGLYTPAEYDVRGRPKVFNDYEAVNRERIEQLEAERGSPYA